jgi:hypothetical protein
MEVRMRIRRLRAVAFAATMTTVAGCAGRQFHPNLGFWQPSGEAASNRSSNEPAGTDTLHHHQSASAEGPSISPPSISPPASPINEVANPPKSPPTLSTRLAPVTPPPTPPPPSVTLNGESGAAPSTLKLLDDTGRRLEQIDRARLGAQDGAAYDQASDFVQAGREAMARKDYVAASGFAVKASTLTSRLPNGSSATLP